jgi:hypothetical protein
MNKVTFLHRVLQLSMSYSNGANMNKVLQLHKQAYYKHRIWHGELQVSVLISAILTDVAVTCKVIVIQHSIFKH